MCEIVKTDLTVVGAGLAGMCCAVAAARRGLSVALINDRSVLGGNASSEIGISICGAAHGGLNGAVYAKETGLIEEIRQMIAQYNSGGGYGEFAIMDAVFFDFIYNEKNIRLFLNTTVTDVECVDGHLTGVRGYHSKSEQSYRFESPLFADCSGDGIAAYKAGAAFMQGSEGKDQFGEKNAPDQGDHTTMGNSIYFEIEDIGTKTTYARPQFAYDIETLPFMQWIDIPENFRGFGVTGKYWTLEVGGDWQIIKDYEDITLDLRKLAFGIWDYVKNSGKYPQADTYILKRIYALAGTRESRRFAGDYILTETDVEQFKEFGDSVAVGGWPMDVHAPKGIYDSRPASNFIPVTGLYNIPYRCLYTRDIDNLFLAGRNISATHIAMGSTRVMATCAAMGQAIGNAAVLCKCDDVLPRDVNVEMLQKALLEDDQTIRIPGQATTNFTASVSSIKPYENVACDHLLQLDRNMGLALPIITQSLDSAQIKVKADKDTTLVIDVLQGSVHDTYCPDKHIKTIEIPLQRDYDDWITIPIDTTSGPDGKVYFVLQKNDDVSYYCTDECCYGAVTKCYFGKQAKEGFDHDSMPMDPQTGYLGTAQSGEKQLCFRAVQPSQDIFGAQNLLNGYTRPWKHCNIWAAADGGEQWVLFTADKMQDIHTLRLFWDTDLAQDTKYVPCPALVKDYDVLVNDRVVMSVRGNYGRMNVVDLSGQKAQTVRINILATHGGNAACYGAVIQ